MRHVDAPESIHNVVLAFSFTHRDIQALRTPKTEIALCTPIAIPAITIKIANVRSFNTHSSTSPSSDLFYMLKMALIRNPTCSGISYSPSMTHPSFFSHERDIHICTSDDKSFEPHQLPMCFSQISHIRILWFCLQRSVACRIFIIMHCHQLDHILLRIQLFMIAAHHTHIIIDMTHDKYNVSVGRHMYLDCRHKQWWCANSGN